MPLDHVVMVMPLDGPRAKGRRQCWISWPNPPPDDCRPNGIQISSTDLLAPTTKSEYSFVSMAIVVPYGFCRRLLVAPGSHSLARQDPRWTLLFALPSGDKIVCERTVRLARR